MPNDFSPSVCENAEKSVIKWALVNSIALRSMLSKIIAPGHLSAMAAQAGSIQRRRKVDPVAFFWALVLGFGAGAEKSLASLRRGIPWPAARQRPQTAITGQWTFLMTQQEETF